MNTKTMVIMITLFIVVIAGAFFLGQATKLVPVSVTRVTSTPFPVSEAEQTSKPVLTSTPISTSVPTVDDQAALIAMVKASEVARVGAVDANAVTYTVSQIQGNYARGMVSASAGGAGWFAAKVNGIWKLVFNGNGTVQCSQLTDYPNFPNSMIPECWDDVNQKNVIR